MGGERIKAGSDSDRFIKDNEHEKGLSVSFIRGEPGICWFESRAGRATVESVGVDGSDYSVQESTYRRGSQASRAGQAKTGSHSCRPCGLAPASDSSLDREPEH